MGSKMALNVLGVAGSMRNGSYSLQALKIGLEHAKKQGAEVRLIQAALPAYDPNAQATPELERATEAVTWADAIIIASPDYHGSMSGTLKNFLDYFYAEFSGKLFGYIVASHEKGLTVMDQMRTAIRQCYGWSMPYGVSINGPQDFAGGEIVNPLISKRLKMMVRDLLVYGEVLKGQFVRDAKSSEENTFAARYRS